jgi:aliphatic nitrilase
MKGVFAIGFLVSNSRFVQECKKFRVKFLFIMRVNHSLQRVFVMERKSFRAAAVQSCPVFLNREKTVAKMVDLIENAASEDADLIVFPEAFIPTYPYWIWLTTPTVGGGKFFREFFKNSVEIPSETTKILCETARENNVYLAVGLNERDGGTLYNTILFINSKGEITGKHRKLQPTYAERMIWGRGNGSDLTVVDTEFGKLGGLICWEHTMMLVEYALFALGEQIHVALWPGISAVKHDPNSDIFNSVAEFAVRHHALAGQTFVINVMSTIDEDTVNTLEKELKFGNTHEFVVPGGGWSAIINPRGQIIGGPLTDKEGIVYAEIDMDAIIDIKHICDSVGHYARWDVVNLNLNLGKYIPYQLHTRALSAETVMEDVAKDRRDEQIRSIIESIKQEATTRNDRKLCEMMERLEQLLTVS